MPRKSGSGVAVSARINLTEVNLLAGWPVLSRLPELIWIPKPTLQLLNQNLWGRFSFPSGKFRKQLIQGLKRLMRESEEQAG